MTARQPRPRRRRVTTPAASLPRPTGGTAGEAQAALRTERRATTGHREHHVTRDYSHVRRDLATIGAFSAVTFAFIFAMWAIL